MPRLTLLSVVHPWHCDQMGHMNVRHYAAMFDDASFQLLGHIADSASAGWADVRSEVDYRHESPVGTLIAIDSTLVRIGRASITYRHVMTDRISGVKHAEALITAVRFDLVERKSLPLSADERQRAEALMEDAASL